MEGRKKIVAGLVTVFAGVLLVSMTGQALFAGFTSSYDSAAQYITPMGAPTAIPGVVYTGWYLQIGISKGGTFGTGNGADGFGVGFQYACIQSLMHT